MKRDDPEFLGLVELARRLRRRQTPAEQILWELLRGRKFLGLKFRRQHRIDRFIVDFYCREQSLVVELDGGIHMSNEQKEIDDNRDVYLEHLSCRVLRFSNQEFLDHPDRVLRAIANACKGVPRFPTTEREGAPSPGRAGAGGRGTGWGVSSYPKNK